MVRFHLHDADIGPALDRLPGLNRVAPGKDDDVVAKCAQLAAHLSDVDVLPAAVDAAQCCQGRRVLAYYSYLHFPP